MTTYSFMSNLKIHILRISLCVYVRLKCKSNRSTVIRGTPRIRSSVDLTVARMILFILDVTTNLIIRSNRSSIKYMHC